VCVCVCGVVACVVFSCHLNTKTRSSPAGSQKKCECASLDDILGALWIFELVGLDL
jgi:hypothetical protein